MTCLEQLEKWVEGESIHNPTRNECTPDFSCCNPPLLWPIEKRREFLAAVRSGDTRKKNNMLMGGLGALLQKETPGKNIAIIGPDD